MFKTLIFLFFVWIHGYAQAGPIDDCNAEFSRQMATLSSVSLNDFDRKVDSGWRLLADAKCFGDARKIIKEYMRENGQQPSLFLHLGQIELRMAMRTEAEESFKNAIKKDEPGDSKFKFNDFSLALAAYAAADFQEFKKHYDVVEKNSDNFGNKMNLKLLNSIRENFNQPYLEILEKI